MPQLPVPPASVWAASPSSRRDANGVLFYSVFANNGQRVYKLVGGQAVEIPLEHLPTARGQLSVESDGLYLTAWDEKAAGLWWMQVPGFALPEAAAGGGGLTPEESETINWVRRVRAVLIQLGRLVFPT